MQNLTYALLAIFAIINLLPLVLPWRRTLLFYCLAAWFGQWLLFFYQLNRESNINYEHRMLDYSVLIALCIGIFAFAVVVRCVARLGLSLIHKAQSANE
ncbi:hypothetical protein [Arenicella xantha]|uniref:Uncharacterized protein n=1 Tax=Arenicella xantha TaxID=644221 RepID=A0A395JEL9_9GAMM|nr:hypothetical protein [Arenicella xantha]RBP47117.1 hypothetical protein DFR28_11080 [Arenicella xantha]